MRQTEATLSPSPRPTEQKKEKSLNKLKERKERTGPLSRLLSQLYSGLTQSLLFPHLDLRLALPSLLGGRDLVLWGLGPLSGSPLPSRWGRWLPAPGFPAGLPLDGTGIRPRPVRSSPTGAFGRPMRAWAAPPRLTSLDGAPVGLS